MDKKSSFTSILLFLRVFLALADDPKDRGTIVAQGGGKVNHRYYLKMFC